MVDTVENEPSNSNAAGRGNQLVTALLVKTCLLKVRVPVFV